MRMVRVQNSSGRGRIKDLFTHSQRREKQQSLVEHPEVTTRACFKPLFDGRTACFGILIGHDDRNDTTYMDVANENVQRLVLNVCQPPGRFGVALAFCLLWIKFSLQPCHARCAEPDGGQEVIFRHPSFWGFWSVLGWRYLKKGTRCVYARAKQQLLANNNHL